MRFLLILLLGGCSVSATAVEIYRCEDRAGRLVLTDQPCRVIGALPLPSERDRPTASPADDAAEVDAGDRAELPLPAPAAASGCPGPTAEALAAALLEAAEQGNLNALAGMYHWPAAGRGAAGRVFAQARRLSQAAPLAFELLPAREDDNWLWAGQPPPDSPRRLPAELLVSRAAESGSVVARFALISHAGCYWLPP